MNATSRHRLLKRLLCSVLSCTLVFSFCMPASAVEAMGEDIAHNAADPQTIILSEAGEGSVMAADVAAAAVIEDAEDADEAAQPESIATLEAFDEESEPPAEEGAPELYWGMVLDVAVTTHDGVHKDPSDAVVPGDVISYHLILTELSESEYGAITVTSALMGLHQAPVSAMGWYDADAHMYDVELSHVVTAADVASGKPIDDRVMLQGPTRTEELIAPSLLTREGTFATEPGCTVAVRGAYDGSDGVDYAVTVTNTGAMALEDLVLDVALSYEDEVPYVGEWTCDVVDPIAIMAGESITFTVHAPLPVGDDSYVRPEHLTCTVSVTSAAADITAGAAATALTRPERIPAWSIALDWQLLDGSGQWIARSVAHVGDTLAYEFTIENTGPVPLTNVTGIVLDDSFVFDDASMVDEIAPGQSACLRGHRTIVESDRRLDENGDPACVRLEALFTADNDGGEYALEPALVSADIMKVVDESEYRIEYWLDEGDGAQARLLGTAEGSAPLGTVVELPGGDAPGELHWGMPKEGYVAEQSELVVGDAPEDNIVKVTFKRAELDWTIEYWLDSDNPRTGTYLGSQGGIAPYGEAVVLGTDLLNAELPPVGYEGVSKDATLFMGVDVESRTLVVVYERAWYGYEVRWLREATSQEVAAGQADERGLMALGAQSGTAQYDRYVSLDNTMVNSLLPDGYVELSGTRQILVGPSTEANEIEIVYRKRTDIGYTVRYWREDTNEDGSAKRVLLRADTSRGTLGEAMAHWGALFAPPGYELDASSVADVPVIGTDASANVLDVVYMPESYGYTVEYWVDEGDGVLRLVESVEGSAPYRSMIPTQVDEHVPAGYSAQNATISGTMRVTDTPASNVVRVVYGAKAQFSYVVNYYAGSLDGELLGSVGGAGELDESISVDVERYLDKAPGYRGPGLVSGAETIGMTLEESTVNVVYPADSFEYEVRYYAGDDSGDQRLLGSVSGDAQYGSIIPVEQGLFAPEGYESSGSVLGSETIGYQPEANVVHVVYAPKRFGFTINYYRGRVAERNLIASVPQDARAFGTTVQLAADELNTLCPDGFTRLTTGRTVQITANEDANSIDVVYVPNFSAFYHGITPIVGTVREGDVVYVAPRGVMAGDVVTYYIDGLAPVEVLVETDDAPVAQIGLPFERATDGVVPIVVMLTRAGVVSRAVTTTVNLASPALPSDEGTGDPADTELEESQMPGAGSAIFTSEAVALGQAVGEALGAVVGAVGSIFDLPTPLYELPGIDLEPIYDDGNPLAASPESHDPLGLLALMGYLLLILATLCLLVAGVLLVLRKRLDDRSFGSQITAAALDRYRMRILTRVTFGLVGASLVLYLLWAFLRL